MKKSLFYFSIFLLMFNAFYATAQTVDIIPLPRNIEYYEGTFDLTQNTRFNNFDTDNNALVQTAELISQKIKFGKDDKDPINIIELNLTQMPDWCGNEGYSLNILPNKISISAQTPTGIFYGAQTLLQLAFGKTKIQCMHIKDAPRFAYRGMHLDVSRHFAPKEFIFKYIDLLASYKLNRFHWHLTDGAGWRIEIKKYPRLTNFAAWRTHEKWTEWRKTDMHYVENADTMRYGGYYTQNDVREIVAYAESRHVTIIPEIEMPGHSEEVCAAYPEISCSGKPYVDKDICIGNDKTFEFFENVLSEIIDLFPSKYIHIGGDEAVKKSWKTCNKCARRMKDENLADVDELQSYFVKRISKFVESKGRKIIGWDEIIDGGLAEGATVMSWRGTERGLTAAAAGHDVIMVPSRYLYLDYYQGNAARQPEAIGGTSTLRNAYSYNPAPDTISDIKSKHIIGVQANIWREFMPTLSHVEYMLLPRMLALAEIAWTPQNIRDWTDFRRRLNAHFPMLKARGYNYCPPLNEIKIISDVDYSHKKIKVLFDTEEYLPQIRYTTNGSAPTEQSALYTKPFFVKDSARVCASIFIDGKPQILAQKDINYHKAIGKKITYNKPYDAKRYPAGGNNALIDGYRGSDTYLDKIWQGFLNDVDVTIDLGKKTTIHKISICFMQLTMPGIYMPKSVEFYTSADGKNFEKIATVANNILPKETKLTFKDFVCAEPKTKVRYIRVRAAHQNGYMFTDEIVVW